MEDIRDTILQKPWYLLLHTVKAVLYSSKGEGYFHVNPGRSFAIFEELVWFFLIEETALLLCPLYSPIALFIISIGVYGLHVGVYFATRYQQSILIEFSPVLFFNFFFKF